MPIKKIDAKELMDEFNDQTKHIQYPQECMLTYAARKCVVSLACKYVKDNDLLEFGTWRGYTTNVLTQALPNKTIWTIDVDHGIDIHDKKYPEW